MLSRTRKLQKLFQPEAIPWLATQIYNPASKSLIFQRHYELIADDILGYCSEGSVLDVGSGPGWLLMKLHEKSPELKLTGVDVSSSMVNKARKNVARSGRSGIIEIEKGNVNCMPFADNSFDAVVSTASVHHWKNPTAGLNGVHRVLREGGYALMYDLVSDIPPAILKGTFSQFGKLTMALFRLLSFAEPFYSQRDFELLTRPTFFKKGRTRFVGLMCCLILKKEAKKEG